jgi:hypothetical protein
MVDMYRRKKNNENKIRLKECHAKTWREKERENEISGKQTQKEANRNIKFSKQRNDFTDVKKC